MRKITMAMTMVAGLAVLAAPVLGQAGQERERPAFDRGMRMGGPEVGPAAWLLEHRDRLDLTDAQVRQIEAIRAEVMQRNEAARQQFRETLGDPPVERGALREMTAEQRAEFRQQMQQRRDQVRPAMQELREANRAAGDRIHELLTDAQKAQLETLRAERRAEMQARRGQRGGPAMGQRGQRGERGEWQRGQQGQRGPQGMRGQRGPRGGGW
jgi:Spy/CpxP family protein refolding chaperone